MKKITLLLVVVLSSTLVFAQQSTGNFAGTDIATTGTAVLSDKGAAPTIELSSDFQTEEGPDLHVYLATDTTATEFTDLGMLEDYTGEQVYEVPEGVAWEEQPVVLIYCEKYSHLFGYAELQ